MSDSYIKFDSTDWDTVRDTYNKVMEHGPQLGTTEDDEDILFDIHEEDVLVTCVTQKNGWTRYNYYHINDYIIEEMFKKE